MRRPALYSRSRTSDQAAHGAVALAASPAAAPTRKRWWKLSPSDPRVLWSAILLLGISLLIVSSLVLRPAGRKITQEDIDAAVLKTLETNTLPSAAARQPLPRHAWLDRLYGNGYTVLACASLALLEIDVRMKEFTSG